MANEVQTSSDATTTGLLRGIINDIGDLIRQEVRFARTEFRADLRKTREAATVLVLGIGTAVLGVILLAVMLVFLLHWLTLPAGAETDPARIPLWGCFGIVSAVFLATGAALSWLGYKKFESFNPLPDETARTVKENVEWMTNSK
jgi:formate hydrogenlyase subunit 3/multisubunit Na+/H+ antiporter MnhD subunit